VLFPRSIVGPARGPEASEAVLAPKARDPWSCCEATYTIARVARGPNPRTPEDPSDDDREIRGKIDAVWNALWAGGIANPLALIEQITYLLFLRRHGGTPSSDRRPMDIRDVVMSMLLTGFTRYLTSLDMDRACRGL